MGEVSIVGLDLAKHVFQVHGAIADGSVAFRRSCRGRRFFHSLLLSHVAW